MSDELIKSQNNRIAELEKAKAQLEVALRGERKDRKALKDEIDTLKAGVGNDAEKYKKEFDDLLKDRDEWQRKANAAPTEKDAEINKLRTDLRTRDYEDLFKDAVGKELADGWTVRDLWHYGEFDPAKVDKIDPSQITELVGKVKTTKPGMFLKPDDAGNASNSQGTARPALTGATDAGRGARDTASGRISYRRIDTATPGWMTKNPALAAAISAGTAVLLPD